MAHTKHTLTRTAYTRIAEGDETVNIQLPVPPYRSGRADRAEVISVAGSALTDTPTVPTDISAANEVATVLENTRYGFVAATQFTVDSADQLWARWLGTHDYTDAADLYVVTF